MRLPVSPVPMLGLPLRFEKWFYSFSPMRQLGGHLLRFAETVARLRGALKRRRFLGGTKKRVRQKVAGAFVSPCWTVAVR